jgi:hypothetical protein
MERSTYPFPLAVNSSHHSHYHRFLLGADPSILEPFPKPYCVGALSGSLPRLTQNLNLPRWRKLYHGAFPWTAGFDAAHYDLGKVAPHRPLPRAYERPLRKFGAYDFVQVADPSVSALALVAGDRRVLERFVALGDAFCSGVETAAGSRLPGPAGSRLSGRILAGQFFEPNNRWLMPFLHVHSRVLNFTSFADAPCRLACIDPGALARAASKEKSHWLERQAEALSDLGYRVAPRSPAGRELRVEGISTRLLAAMEAPRIAVLRLLERIIAGDRPPCVGRLAAELPPEVIAAMADQLDSVLARSLWRQKPGKIGIPPEGPWKIAVREHLAHYCPGELEGLDAAAARARAVVCTSCVFPTPPLDPAHCHTPETTSLDAASQSPTDPELGADDDSREPEWAASPWLVGEFERTVNEVNERLVRAGPGDPLIAMRGLLAEIDHLAQGADAGQLRQSGLFLGAEIERRARPFAPRDAWGTGRARAERVPLASLDELFESACMERPTCEQEIGGRSL